MNSQADRDFWDLFAALPERIRRAAYQAFAQFQHDPFHPSLNFKEVNKRMGIWSARVTQGYRVLGYREGSNIRWFWIGTHTEYEKIIKGR